MVRGREHIAPGRDAARAQLPLRQVHAREVAAAVGQRGRRIDVTDIAEIHLQPGFPAQQLAQRRHRESVAGMDANDRAGFRQHGVDLALEFLRQVLQLRAQTRLQALARPHKPLPERRQDRAAPLAAFHQRRLEELRPLLDQVPGMPIADLRAFGRAADLAGGTDLVEEIQHDEHGAGITLLGEAPDGLDFNAEGHQRSRCAWL